MAETAIEYLQGIVDDYGDDYLTPDELNGEGGGRIKVVRAERITDHRRWDVHKDIVLEVLHDDMSLWDYVEISWRSPATESQDYDGPGSWDYAYVVPTLVSTVAWTTVK